MLILYNKRIWWWWWWYLTSIDTFSPFSTVSEIFDFKIVRVLLQPSTSKSQSGSKIVIPFESPYMTSYLNSMDTISLSHTVFEIFDFKIFGFDLDLWPLKAIWGQNFSYHSKGNIWLLIWILWTSSFYLVPFSRYSTSKFWRSSLDLWPLKVIWGQKNLYHSKANEWLPIYLIWTPSLFLVPFSRYSTSKFSRGSLYMTFYLTSEDTISLSRTVFEIFDFKIFRIWLWPLKVIWGQQISYYSKAHIWLPIWLLWTTSVYLVPISR